MLKQDNYSNKNERGVVLVVSLLFLMILTLIGISSAKTSVMQEKIANHSGLQQAAFQAADSCVNRLLQDSTVFTSTRQLQDIYSGTPQYLVSNSMSNRSGFKAQQLYAGQGTPPRGSGYSTVNFRVAHNEHRCQGFTTSSAVRVTVRQGVFQVFPKI
jgi:hypothetical protein